jgi:general secretion pathway protein A
MRTAIRAMREVDDNVQARPSGFMITSAFVARPLLSWPSRGNDRTDPAITQSVFRSVKGKGSARSIRSERSPVSAPFADIFPEDHASLLPRLFAWANSSQTRTITQPRVATLAAHSMSTAFDLYTKYFGLTERPFSLLPDPDFLFWAAEHTRAYTMLEYGVLTRAPITLITGEVGAGKTTLMQHLLRNLDSDMTVGLISNAHGDRGELLRWVMMALGQNPDPKANYVELFAAFQAFLIAEYARGQRVVLIFDEAQNMTRESLEELRMFTNINSNKDELLQLILIGQPELRDMIRRPDMKQIAQRVAASFHLTHMDAPTVLRYIRHRLEVAGAKKDLFSEAAANLVHRATGGIPRLVNQLCDLAMVYACTSEHGTVRAETVQAVLDDGVFFGHIEQEKREGASE